MPPFEIQNIMALANRVGLSAQFDYNADYFYLYYDDPLDSDCRGFWMVPRIKFKSHLKSAIDNNDPIAGAKAWFAQHQNSPLLEKYTEDDVIETMITTGEMFENLYDLL